MANPLGYPLINQRAWDFASMRILIPNIPPLQAVAFRSVDYSNDRTPGHGYGTAAAKIARGRGQVKAEGTLDLYAWFDAFLIQTLAQAFPGQGSMEWTFKIVIQYSETGIPVKTDELPGCQFTGSAQAHSEGPNLLLVKRKIDIMPYVIENGIHPITGPNGVPFFNG